MKPVKVRFENGVFKPIEKAENIEEGAIGEVYIEEKTPVRASEFFGLWKDRQEIKDGDSYVREIRRKSRY